MPGDSSNAFAASTRRRHTTRRGLLWEGNLLIALTWLSVEALQVPDLGGDADGLMLSTALPSVSALRRGSSSCLTHSFESLMRRALCAQGKLSAGP